MKNQAIKYGTIALVALGVVWAANNVAAVNKIVAKKS